MISKVLINAVDPEECRIAKVIDNKLEEFHIESASKEIKITPERMPQLEIVRIKIDSQPRENRFNKNPRNNFNKTPRRFNNENHSRRFIKIISWIFVKSIFSWLRIYFYSDNF